MPKIRRYRCADWHCFIELEVQTVLDSRQPMTEEQMKEFRRQWPGKVRRLYQWSASGPTANNSLLLVLEAGNGDFAGHLWVCEQDDFFTGERKLFVLSVAIDPKYRGRGWGRKLMQRTEQEARARRLTRIGLGVEVTNERAIRLYRGHGYQTRRLVMERRSRE